MFDTTIWLQKKEKIRKLFLLFMSTMEGTKKKVCTSKPIVVTNIFGCKRKDELILRKWMLTIYDKKTKSLCS